MKKRYKTLRRDRQSKKVTIIGVIGLASGVGVTHVALLLAGFVRAFYGRKTIYLEVNGKDDVSCFVKAKGNEKCIIRHKVAYMPLADKTDIMHIRNSEYDVCVLDLGSKFLIQKEELLRCDYKIIIGGAAPWQRYMWTAVEEVIKEVKNYSSFQFLVNLSDISDDIRKLIPKASINVMPYEPDLNRISEKTLHLFHSFFQTIM